MSMKRSRSSKAGPRPRTGADDNQRFAFTSSTPAETPPRWEDVTANKPDDAFVPYSLATRFEKGALIQHSKFGKGFVVRVDGSRIDVLFAEGTKTLGHKPG
jgi:hypothetical protein